MAGMSSLSAYKDHTRRRANGETPKFADELRSNTFPLQVADIDLLAILLELFELICRETSGIITASAFNPVAVIAN
jgi:hypothetical protein